MFETFELNYADKINKLYETKIIKPPENDIKYITFLCFRFHFRIFRKVFVFNCIELKLLFSYNES